jgi:alpha-L-glutamate ligase-like protein
MIEYRVRPSRLFEAISYRGVPDIRLLIFRGVPTMAMVRLPTRSSDGKANLHQGAVGVGIALSTGITGHGVMRDGVVEDHPDFGNPLAGHAIPDWEALLAIGARCADLTGLGYCGVDLVLDEERGPMMLEINARPGLAIQIANQCGLEQRLKTIAAMPRLPTEVDQRIALARGLDADATSPLPRTATATAVDDGTAPAIDGTAPADDGAAPAVEGTAAARATATRPPSAG